jgi:FKBP-type peptidyl-prolyl cis-trans isomerase FklB
LIEFNLLNIINMNFIKSSMSLLVGILIFSSINAQQMDSVSYSLGVLIAQNLKNQGFENLDANSLSNAIQAVLEGNELEISAEKANIIVQQYAQKQAEEAQKAQAAQYEPVIAKNKEFFATNGAREDVTTLPSGVQYEVIKAGEGAKPGPTDKVTVHYHGTLLDGTVFDSSVNRGQPATFGLNQVIPGWTEALQLMPVGSKWRLFLPSDAAYGARGAGDKITPYSALIFEVELISIN